MPQRSSTSRNLVAVIDVGSNSGRVVVFERDASNHLRPLAGSRASLRLVEDVDDRGKLSEVTMAHVTDALRDFKAIAKGAGARRVVAVATAAMRDASNGAMFVKRLQRELAITIEIISGNDEARYGFAGAIRGLPVTSGVLFDVGGGSMELTRFDRRRVGKDVCLPLGALRLSTRFLESDPPTRPQLRRLREHVRERLAQAGLRRLSSGDRLVGTGGTLRNLAKIDREAQRYPIATLHGYDLPLDRLTRIVEQLASLKEKRRDDLPGLSADRADSIVGGAVAIQAMVEFLRGRSVVVSSQGVREGLALDLLDMPAEALEQVKEAALSSLVARFADWRRDTADRRRAVTEQLLRAIEPRAPAMVVTAAVRAAEILDIGRSLDVTNRHAHVADILLSTDLNGFTHAELALLAAIVRRAGDRHADVESLAAIGGVRPEAVERTAIVLALADEIEARCPPGRPIAVRSRAGRDVTLSVPVMPSWLEEALERRFRRAFGRGLIVRH